MKKAYTLNNEKVRLIEIAKELHYPFIVIQKLHNAISIYELTRIMHDARNRYIIE